MSTQLILYPQYYQGFSSTSNPSFNQFITNGALFTGLSTAALYSTNAVNSSQDAINNAYPTILGNWYRYTTIVGTPGNWGAVAAPQQILLSQLQLSFSSPEGNTGIYQQMSNLIPGASYDIKMSIVTTQVGTLTVNMFSGTILNAPSQAFTNPSGVIATTFTAQTSNDIFLLNWRGDATLLINSISIKESPMSPSLIFSDLDDGQVICDLYQEEDIPLSLSIDDFKNVAEKVQSYSKDFNLPATKRNNQIFNDMYEVTRSVTGSVIFNPYVKTKCVLKQDGFILFEGFLRLIDVKDKEGEISYNVNLYSEVVALADALKDKTFSDLDFSELEHNYNKTSIKNSWYEPGSATGLPLTYPLSTSSFAYNSLLGVNQTDVLKYPFIDWNHQFVLGGYGGHPSATLDRPELTTLEQAFRPCIQIKYIINKIFAASGFNWTSNFLETSIANGGDFDFDRLFMDFNWGGDDTPSSILGTGQGIYYAQDADSLVTATFSPINLPSNSFPSSFGFAANVFTCPVGQNNSTYNLYYDVTFRCYSASASFTDLQLRWLHTEAATGNLNVIDATPSITMISSASAEVTTAVVPFFSGRTITNIDIIDGGYYPSGTPTVTFLGGGFGESVTVNMTGTAVSSVTIISGGNNWSYLTTRIVFNNVNPLYRYSGIISAQLEVGDTLQLQMEASATLSIRQDNVRSVNIQNIVETGRVFGSVSTVGVTNASVLNTLRGETGQWDFLKGIMTMFNLITMVDENNPNNILIEPYAEVFIKNTNSLTATTPTNNSLAARSIEHDWTDKVDVSEMELKPLTDLNKNTIFKFVEDDDDYVFRVYKESTSGHLYGSYINDASGFTILEGEKEIIAEPFAATVSKPLMSEFTDFIVPSLYSLNDDGSSEAFDNSPRIFYNNGRQNTGTTFFICGQNGFTGENQSHFLQFSHLTTIPTIINGTQDFVFRSNQLMQPIGNPPTNNLFSVYWQPYFDELYSPDTRTMTLKVNLSPADVASFKFYDTVFIKNRAFRVNKIDYKPNNLATVEFILIP